MKTLIQSIRSQSGFSMTETLVSCATTAILAAGMLCGITTIQTSFTAAEHHAKSQVEQTRIVDYISRDLRRALSVTVDTFQGAQRITMTIPDYYDTSDGTPKPRDPQIVNGGIVYGVGTPATSTPVSISYYKSGATMYRRVNGVDYELATNVKDFEPSYTDDKKQVIGISVSFVPKFQLNAKDVSSLKLGTTVYASTLLRNKRVN